MCGYTLTEAYWRIRNKEGLMPLYDRETLDLWSKVITKFRRYCGSPLPLPGGIYVDFKKQKEEILSHMERYRDMLCSKADKTPERLCGEWAFLAGAAIMEKFNEAGLNPMMMDEDSLNGFILSIDYAEIKERVNNLIPRYNAFIEDKNKRIEEVEKEIKETNKAFEQQKQLILEVAKKEETWSKTEDKLYSKIEKSRSKAEVVLRRKIRNIAREDFLEKLDRKTKGQLEWPVDSVDTETGKRAVWQIRTDLANRSSKGADICNTLYYFWTVNQWSGQEDRDIMEEDLRNIDKFINWKMKLKKADKERMKKEGKHLQYDEQELVDNIATFLHLVKWPVHPLDKGENEENQTTAKEQGK